MSPKKYKSDKKTSTQTIAISPALKDWVERYVNKMREEHPEEENYKSVSAFYCDIIEKVLRAFETGKTLKDFDRMQDSEIEDFYKEDTTNMYIPYVEPAVELNKYEPIDFKTHMRYFLSFYNLFKSSVDPYEIKSIKTFFERIKKRYLYSKLTKDMHIEVIPEKGKAGYSVIIEHTGNYNNLHLLNCKMAAVAFGMMGAKIVDFHYSNQDIYYRFDIETTDLLFDKKTIKNEREQLMKHNLEFLINFNRILSDKDEHLWMRLANNKDIIITYNNLKDLDKVIEELEKDLRNYGKSDELLLKLLKLFEKLHWIIILKESDLSFQIILSENRKEERKYLLEYLSKKGKVSENNGILNLSK